MNKTKIRLTYSTLQTGAKEKIYSKNKEVGESPASPSDSTLNEG
jgi:hypothetical protein